MTPFHAPRSVTPALRVFIFFVICVFGIAASSPAAWSAGAGSTSSAAPQATGSGDANQSMTLNQLANIIENKKTREQLVAELRHAASANQKKATKQTPRGKTQKSAKAAAPAVVAQPSMSFARRFAQTTSAWSEAIGSEIGKIWSRVTALAKGQGAHRKHAMFNMSAFIGALTTFLLIAASTVIAFVVLRLLAAFVYGVIARFAARSQGGRRSLLRRFAAIACAILIDVAIVLLACGAGYTAGLYAFGESGSVGLRASLFINAFALVELIKVAIRACFTARYDSLRLFNIPAEIAAWWDIRLRLFISVVGYGLLVAVPISTQQLSSIVGVVLTFVVMGGAYIYALIVIFGNRRLLTQRLIEHAHASSIGFFSFLYLFFARVWIVIALAYFTTLFAASQLYPTQVLPGMLWATVQTLIIAAIGIGISGFLSRLIGRRINFSDNIREKLPMLEVRINSYVPNALKVVRMVILVIVVVLIANAWHLFNLGVWLASDGGEAAIVMAVHVAIVLLAAALLWVISASIIEHRLSPNTGHGAPSARQQTLLVLFRNALAIAIATFTVMIALSQIGVNIGPLIAGAGVFGLAIGFGAQKLVQDIITGVFIQLENAINTGDTVSVAGITGTAERLTIRSVSIRDIDGAYHIVPFSSVDVATNYVRDWAYFRTEYGIAYREDIDNAIYYLREAFAELRKDPAQGPSILEDMNVAGVTALADSAVQIRIMIKTLPGKQWGLGRAFNRLVKIHFDRAGIEIPFPHQTLYFGEDREGKAPPANVRLLEHDDIDPETPRKLKRRRRGDDPAPEETGDAPS